MKNIIFDLDGTILEKDLTLSLETVECIKKISKNNIISIATGRSLVGIPQSVSSIESCISFYVTTNGAFVYDKNKNIIYKDPIGFNNAISFIKEISEFNVFLEVLSEEKWHMCSHDLEKLTSLNLSQKTLNYILSTRTKHDDLLSFIIHNSIEVDKISVNICSDASRIEIEPVVEKLCKKYDLRCCSDKAHKIDVYKQTTNKGNAIKFLSSFSGVDLTNTISFGNDENDIEMFNLSGFSICMPTIFSKAKKNASYVVRNNNEARISRCIRQLKYNKGINLFR